MKKLAIITVFMGWMSASVFGQIKFENNMSWEQVLKKAQKEKKMLFLHLENDQCIQCNEVATQGFNGSVLREKFAVNFVCLRLHAESDQGRALAQLYGVKGFPTSLFLDTEGYIVHRYNGSTSASLIYMEQAETALSKRHEKSLGYYEKEYKAGNRNRFFLEDYIVKLKSASMPIQTVLDEYVGGLTVDSFANFRIVKFVLTQGPTVDSRAFKVVRAVADGKLMDSVYQSMPYNEAVTMNNQIINASLEKAIQQRNHRMMLEVTNFARSTHKNNYRNGEKNATQLQLMYSYAVKDTQSYLSMARYFYDNFYMNTSADSLRKYDQKIMREQMKTRSQTNASIGAMSFSYSPPSQYHHIELNKAAWHFWELATKQSDLEKALQWSQRAMYLFEELRQNKPMVAAGGNANYMDTYAHLLYKLNRRKEAIEWMAKAIEAHKAMGQPVRSFEVTKEKMETGRL
jgi:tetratricopeptide (TPR) repeat protein